jgi:hypothetical protein
MSHNRPINARYGYIWTDMWHQNMFTPVVGHDCQRGGAHTLLNRRFVTVNCQLVRYIGRYFIGRYIVIGSWPTLVESEVESMVMYGVWEPAAADLPPGKQALPGFFIFDLKQDGAGCGHGSDLRG